MSAMTRLRAPLVLALAVLAALPAQDALPHAIDPAGVPGTLVIAGGGSLPDAVHTAFLEAAGGEAANIVVIPTASRRADADGAEDDYLESWRARPHGSLTFLHTRDREHADTDDFSAALEKATGVWFGGGNQRLILDAYRDTLVEERLMGLLARGGVIGGSSAGAACMSRVMIQGGAERPDLTVGFDFLPHAVVDQHFSERSRQPRLRAALVAHPGRCGVGLDEGTALVVRGRRLEVIGRGRAHFFVAAGAGRDAREVSYGPGDRIDLVSWQRGARERLRQPFPPADRPAVRLAAGHVMMVGGGRVGEAILTRFLDLAGGKDAPIVVVPTAAGRSAARSGFERVLRRHGATNVRVFHVDHPSEVADHEDLPFLQKARGVWFGGGRQWRLVDAYEGTPAFDAFHAVLARGGVVAGTSAGSSIQPDYMVRGHPLGNREMMALGYERGFGLLPGVAADQHFAQRDRFADMTRVMEAHPQLLGLGIDEGTAALVTGTTLEVLGPGKVAVYDWMHHEPSGEGPDHLRLGAGEGYDLDEGTLIQ